MKDRIRIAVVGCGYWGPNLYRNFRSLAGCEAKVICDLNLQRLNHLKALYPDVEVSTDFEELVGREDIDALAIATSVRTHYGMARQALLAGKHVLIEKPMATSVAECEDLTRIAHEKRLTLMVGHTFLYSAPVRRIKEIIKSGDIGNIQYISARRLNLGLFQKDINVAWDLAPHDISIILYITGEMPLLVNCRGNSHVTRGVEDVTNMALTFSNQLL